MAKLTEDQIRWVLSVQSTEAQQELHRLSQASKDLSKDQRDVRKAMNELIAAGKKNSDEFRNLEKEYKRLGDEIATNKQLQDELSKKVDLTSLSMNELRKRAKDLRTQLNATSRADNPKAWDEQRAQLQAVEAQMKSLAGGSETLTNSLRSFPGPASQATSAISGFGQSLKLLAANPVGIVIIALVAAFAALKTAIAGSDDATTKYQGLLAALRSVLDSVKRSVTETFALLYNLVTFDFKAAKENIRNLSEIGGQMKENAEAAYEATLAEDALSDAIARNNDVTEVNKSRIAELRLISKDLSKTNEERTQATAELMQLESDNYKMMVDNISGQYEVFKGLNRGLVDAIKRSSGEQFEQVEKYMAMVQEGTELTYRQRLELANLVNDITSTLDRGTEEEKEKFRSFFSDISKMQKEYYDGIRRDRLTEVQLEQEEKNKRKEAARKAREQAIKNLDNQGKEELNALKKQYAERTIAKAQYEQELQNITENNLRRKLASGLLEVSAQKDIESQLLDLQIKRYDDAEKKRKEADKTTLDRLKKTRDSDLKDLDSHFKQELAVLQSKQAAGIISEEVYNARKLILDREAAEARLQVDANYQELVMSADIQTQELRIEAVTAANAAIAASEQALQDKRLEIISRTEHAARDLRKELGVQSAVDEFRIRQEAIIASAEARRVLLLGENYKERELTEEEQARLLELNAVQDEAMLALTRAHEEQKRSIRKQYGMVTIAEELQAEVDALTEQHRAGLLSTEQYEIAKAQLKIRKVAETQQHLTALVSNAVNALQQAELAAIDAKYDAKIQAAAGNEQEIARLEEKREASKLDTQKKYADVQFAIKVSEIISSTAVAIMQGYAQLGPIAGSVAAAMLAVTGAAQVAVANAERQKVKNARPGGNAGNGPAVRVATGREEGGYIDVEREQDGRRYQALFAPRKRGYVDRPTVIVGEGPAGHSREWVANNDALSNPTVAPLIAELDYLQRIGRIRTVDMNSIIRARMAGFESGGFIGLPASPSPTAPQPSAPAYRMEEHGVMLRLLSVLENIDNNGIRADVLLDDFERQYQRKNESQNLAKR